MGGLWVDDGRQLKSWVFRLSLFLLFRVWALGLEVPG